jgi:hypothetical protein
MPHCLISTRVLDYPFLSSGGTGMQVVGDSTRFNVWLSSAQIRTFQ